MRSVSVRVRTRFALCRIRSRSMTRGALRVRAAAAEARFDRVQRVEQSGRREIGVAGDDRVQILRRRRIDRIGLDETADADDVHHVRNS